MLTSPADILTVKGDCRDLEMDFAIQAHKLAAFICKLVFLFYSSAVASLIPASFLCLIFSVIF